MTEEIVEQQTINNTARNCFFASSDGVAIRSIVDIKEKLYGMNVVNKYRATFTDGKKILCVEDSNCLGREFFGNGGCFTIHILNEEDKKEMLTFTKNFDLYFPSIHVYDTSSKKKKYLGKVKQRLACFSTEFSILDEKGKEIYHLKGPVLPKSFSILENGQKVGVIKDEFTGLVKEYLTDKDNFGVQFPSSATFTKKCIILGAAFLISYNLFGHRISDEKE
eukprot:gene5683-9504_t